MTKISLENIECIRTADRIYNKVVSVEEQYSNGIPFFLIKYHGRIELVKVDQVTNIQYRNTKTEFNTQKEVLDAYKDGRLVGF